MLASGAVLLAVAALVVPAAAVADDDPHLPRWHVVPTPHNWMNDPNGPFFDPVHKKYHLMYQYQVGNS